MEHKGSAKRSHSFSRQGKSKKFKKKIVFKNPATLVRHSNERKVIDVNNGGSPPATLQFDTTGHTICLGCLETGGAVNQRLGRRVQWKSLQIRGMVEQTAEPPGGSPDQLARIICYYDRQPNGALAAVADLLTSVDVNTNDSSTVYDMLNIGNAGRFKVLWDHTFKLADFGATDASRAATDYRTYSFNHFIPLRDIESQFLQGNSGTVTDIASGAINLLCIGSVAAANATHRLSFVSRLRFHDL